MGERRLSGRGTNAERVWLMMAGAAALFFWLQWKRHSAFESSSDLGWILQSLFTTVHGDGFFWSSLVNGSAFGIHVFPILLLILPVFALAPAAETLFAIQALVVAAGIVPIWHASRPSLGEHWAAALVLAYLLHPLVLGMVVFDANPMAYAAFPLLAATNALLAGRSRACWGWAIVALMVREDVGLAVAALGLYGWWRARSNYNGGGGGGGWGYAGMAALGFIWLVVAVKGIAPRFQSPGGFQVVAEHYKHLGGSLGGMLTTLLSDPGQILRLLLRWKVGYYLAVTLGGVAFLPFLDLPLLLVSLPGYLRLFLLGDDFHLILHLHYGALMVPFLFMAAIHGLKRVRPLPSWALPGFMTIVVLMAVATSGPIMHHVRKPITPHETTLREFVARVPPTASVAADGHLFPHLATRRHCYRLDSARLLSDPPDYLILDLLHPDLAIAPHPLSVLVRAYRVIEERDGAQLLIRYDRPSPLGPKEKRSSPQNPRNNQP